MPHQGGRAIYRPEHRRKASGNRPLAYALGRGDRPQGGARFPNRRIDRVRSAMSRKICVITGARSDYGCLRWVMEGIAKTEGLQLQVVATGMHLSPQFGLTYRDIERDGFRIDRKIDMLLSADTAPAL